MDFKTRRKSKTVSGFIIIIFFMNYCGSAIPFLKRFNIQQCHGRYITSLGSGIWSWPLVSLLFSLSVCAFPLVSTHLTKTCNCTSSFFSPSRPLLASSVLDPRKCGNEARTRGPENAHVHLMSRSCSLRRHFKETSVSLRWLNDDAFPRFC